MVKFLNWTGILLCLVLPAIAFIGIGSMSFMPTCTGGSSGPASGCYLFGTINLNWLVQLGTFAFVGSFLTVPVGVVVLLLAGIVGAFSKQEGE